MFSYMFRVNRSIMAVRLAIGVDAPLLAESPIFDYELINAMAKLNNFNAIMIFVNAFAVRETNNEHLFVMAFEFNVFMKSMQQFF